MNGIFREYYETRRQRDKNESSEVDILIKENNEKILLEAEQPWNIFEDDFDLPCLLPDYQHGINENMQRTMALMLIFMRHIGLTHGMILKPTYVMVIKFFCNNAKSTVSNVIKNLSF